MQSKRDIGIMRAEKRGKNEGERDKMLENTEIVKEKTQQTLGAVHTHTHTHTHIYSYRRIAGQPGESYTLLT